eukprot:1817285-Rhodomonas_salina.1
MRIDKDGVPFHPMHGGGRGGERGGERGGLGGEGGLWAAQLERTEVCIGLRDVRSTEIVYAASARRCNKLAFAAMRWAVVLSSHTLSDTELAYDATRVLRDVRY